MEKFNETIKKEDKNLLNNLSFNKNKVPLIRESTRILRPMEYKLIYNSIPRKDYKTLLNALLLTGMRYIELQRFQSNPEWFDGDFIHLPVEAQRKVTKVRKKRKDGKERASRRHKARVVILNSLGKNVISYFIDINTPLPGYQSWKDDLRRWAKNAGLDPQKINVKTTRKTWCSWLLATYGTNRLTEITLSMGHDSITSIKHYLSVGFTDDDKSQIKEYTEGWIKKEE